MAKYNQLGGNDTELQKRLNKNVDGTKPDSARSPQIGTKTIVAKLDGPSPRPYEETKANQSIADAYNKEKQSVAAAYNNRQGLDGSNPGAFSYGAYEKSDAVKQAEAMLQQQLGNKPGAYQSSWQSQMNDTLNKILNRENFSYNLNGDALYQQYKDQYMLQGQQAMMDTMGQAQAMTGGYGNSYAQQVGQQTYQGYLQQLNDKVPELYQLALDQYNREGQNLYNQYGLFADRENQDYGRYRDSVSDYYTELDRLADEARYQGEQDYGKYMDAYNMAYGQHRDTVADSQWQKTFDEGLRQYEQNFQYQQSRDQVADSQWDKSFEYQQSRDQVADSQWDKSFQYQQDRDKVADQQWNDSFAHQKEQDAIANQQWQDSFNYQQGRDQVADSQWQSQFDYAKSQDQRAYEQWLQQFQYQQDRDAVSDQQWQDSFNYQQGRDQVADQQWNDSFAYQQERDKVSDNQWEKSFEEGVRQFDEGKSGSQVANKEYKSIDVGSAAYKTILADIDMVETYDDLLAITKRYIALGYDPDEIDELTAGKAKKLKPKQTPTGGSGGVGFPGGGITRPEAMLR